MKIRWVYYRRYYTITDILQSSRRVSNSERVDKAAFSPSYNIK